ncbi:MAG: 3-isopropylmalate dehydratase small subunit [Chlamydiota bacterium]
MQAFQVHTGKAAPLDRPNVDTDQIIPKQFLKRIERSGYGQFLFYDWRYLPDGKPDPSFVLNQPAYAGASILIAGKNFGCGSSREHAPWALLDYGIRAIIAPSFADIFANNCTKNGLLPLVLEESKVMELMGKAGGRVEVCQVTVDLVEKQVRDSSGFRASFEIDDFKRKFLLEGLDDIGLSLKFQNDITAYEQRRRGYFNPST